MCRSHADGGRRCSRANPTRSWRTAVTERQARNFRVAAQADPVRAEHLHTLVERDTMLLGRIGEAVERYGECVTEHHIDLPPDVQNVVDGLADQGFRALLVGGSVRDSFDGRAPKDLDFEVYGGTVDQVAAAARRHGRVDEVGRAFGVLKMRLADGSDLDLSVPRRDNKTGVGHRGFGVDLDSTLTVSEAAERRDFTVNALSYDPRLGVLIDPHHGQDDLLARRLRHVSPAFAEDPLRVLRGVQFAARYDMRMDPETVALCRNLRSEAETLPTERVQGEWAKFYGKGSHPGRGLAVLRRTGWDAVHPGLSEVNDARLRRETTRMTTLLDEAGVYGQDRVAPMAAVIASRMDEPTAKAFLARTVEGGGMQRRAFALSRPADLPTTPAEARLAAVDDKVSLRERVWVAQAQGRRPEALRALALAEGHGVADRPEADLVNGRDVMALTDRKPGPWLGELLTSARTAQAEGGFRDRDRGLDWLAARV